MKSFAIDLEENIKFLLSFARKYFTDDLWYIIRENNDIVIAQNFKTTTIEIERMTRY